MNSFPKIEPSQSMLPLKRTRAKRSCDFCRKRKARCDAEHTIPCSNCKAWGYTCQFLTVCRKRGPPSVYVKNLEQKCKKMELLLTSLTKKSIQELENSDYSLDSLASVDEIQLVKNEIRNDNDEESQSDTSDYEQGTTGNVNMEETVANLGLEDYDSLKYTGQSACFQLIDHNLFPAKNILHLPGREDVVFKLMPENELLVIRSNAGKRKHSTRLDIGFSLNSSIFDEARTQNTSSLDDCPSKRALPSEKLIEKAYQLYFTHIHTFLPLLNKDRFRMHDSKKSSSILSQAVLAVAFRFASRHFPKLFNAKKANFYAETYYKKVNARLQDSHRTGLRHVQAALLITLYLDMDETDVESMQWFTLGKAIRMAQDIGLHRSCSNWTLPPSEIETRHRVFYSCYVLDRLMGARAGKPLTILDRDFDTDLPKTYEVNDDNQTGPPVYQAFIFLIKLSEIYGRILKALYAPKSKPSNSNAGLDDPTILAVLDRRLRNWKKSLDCTEISQAQKVNLLLFYYTSILLLHRPFLNAPSSYASISSESLLACENAALNISVIIHQKQLLMSDPDSYAPLCLPTCFVYSMFQSSLVHLAIVIRNKHSMRQLKSLRRSIELLQQYTQLISARRACSTLLMLVNMHHINLDDIPDVDPNLLLPQSPVSPDKLVYSETTEHHHLDDLTFDDDDEQMPKSSWYMRMMNPSVVGGITQDLNQKHPHDNNLYHLLPYPTTATNDSQHYYPPQPMVLEMNEATKNNQLLQKHNPASPYYHNAYTTASSSSNLYCTMPPQPSSLNWNEWDTYLTQQKSYPIL